VESKKSGAALDRADGPRARALAKYRRLERHRRIVVVVLGIDVVELQLARQDVLQTERQVGSKVSAGAANAARKLCTLPVRMVCTRIETVISTKDNKLTRLRAP
jgi:hypothetical protein